MNEETQTASRAEWERIIRKARAMGSDFEREHSAASASSCYGVANRIEKGLHGAPAGGAVTLALAPYTIRDMHSFDLLPVNGGA